MYMQATLIKLRRLLENKQKHKSWKEIYCKEELQNVEWWYKMVMDYVNDQNLLHTYEIVK